MNLPFDKVFNVMKLGVTTSGDADAPVRVAVYVDATATPFLIGAVRDAFVPQTTSAIVRVERLNEAAPTVKPDTDVAIVISCGSPALQGAVQQIVVGGAPVVVLSESSVEVPFIETDTRMLGLIAATDKTYLLETLARWILDRTEKDTAFAANFPFMRIAAANRIITSTALTNLATGALAFIPGADFPVMTLAQIGMAMQLASVFGKPLRTERAYEVAGVVAAGLLLRAGARLACRHSGRLAFVVKAAVGGLGTYGMGRALASLYERDVDYSAANEVVAAATRQVRKVAAHFIARADDHAATPSSAAAAA